MAAGLDEATRAALADAEDGGDAVGARAVSVRALRAVRDEARMAAYTKIARALAMQGGGDSARGLLEEMAGVLGIPEEHQRAVAADIDADVTVRLIADRNISERRFASAAPTATPAAAAHDPAACTAIAGDIRRAREEIQQLSRCLALNTDQKEAIKLGILERRAALDDIVDSVRKLPD